MNEKDKERQDVDWIMRRASELGHDPARVERALNHRPPPSVEYQPVVEVEAPRRWFGARAAQRLARRS